MHCGIKRLNFFVLILWYGVHQRDTPQSQHRQEQALLPSERVIPTLREECVTTSSQQKKAPRIMTKLLSFVCFPIRWNMLQKSTVLSVCIRSCCESPWLTAMKTLFIVIIYLCNRLSIINKPYAKISTVKNQCIVAHYLCIQ